MYSGSVICRTGRRPLDKKVMSKNSVLCNLHIKACFDHQENPSKVIQNDYIINNQWFRETCIILHNLQTSLEKSVLSKFQIGACLNQHSKPRKLV